MRFSIRKRIFAVLLCCCVALTSGCFPIHSILGNEYYDYSQSGSIDLDIIMMSQNQAVSGEYPDGKRAFKFKNCTYEADISDFKLIDIIGNVTVYFYTGITVLNDDEVGTESEGDSSSDSGSDSSSDSSLVNKKGYYDKSRAKLRHFWTIAAYNFETEEYMDIMTKTYNPVNDAGKMNGNPVVFAKSYYLTKNSPLLSVYAINVGYFFIKFVLYRNDYNEIMASTTVPDFENECMDFGSPETHTWKLSNDNKKQIREALGIKGDANNFCCTDFAVKNKDENKFAATFMILPTDENFNQKNVMFEVELTSEVKDNKTVDIINLEKKVDNVKTVAGGNLLSSNFATGNCIYVTKENSIKDENIEFGIDRRDRKTSFEIKIGKTSDGNNVLQSFSVKDYTEVNDKGNEEISTEESRLELVFKNRIEYYKIERYTMLSFVMYRAVYLKTYWLNEFCSTYLSSDDIPSILDFSWGVNISSTTDGMRNIFESGNTNWSSRSGAAYLSARYGGKTLVIGFDGFTFDKTVRYFDDDGNETGVSKSKSEFTLAQLPFATVRIV